MKEIYLTQGKIAIVDEEDYKWLSQWTWSHCPNRKKDGYAQRAIYLGAGKCRTVYMHRLIMNATDAIEVDHINQNGLDNRRCNLRFADSQNQFNRNKQKNNTSGYKGVWKKQDQHRKNPWFADIKCQNKRIRLGGFTTAEEAARAYDEKAKELHGEFACLNFPD